MTAPALFPQPFCVVTGEEKISGFIFPSGKIFADSTIRGLMAFASMDAVTEEFTDFVIHFPEQYT